MKRSGSGYPHSGPAVRQWALTLLLAPLAAGCGPGANGGESVAPPTVPVPAPGPTQPGPQNGCPSAAVAVDEFTASQSVLKASLSIELPNTAADVWFDWAGPYLDLDPTLDGRFPILEVAPTDWKMTRTATTTRHSLKIAWAPFREAVLGFHSAQSGCDLPMLVCAKDGCEVRP